MGHEFPLSSSPLAVFAPNPGCDSDIGDESGDDCASLPPGSGSRPASTSINEALPPMSLSGEALAHAFYKASFSAPKGISPREVLRMGLREEPAARIFEDEKFIQALGYANFDEVKGLIGCVDKHGRVDETAKALYRPVRRWALDGKIDKKQFCELKISWDFRSYLRLFENGYLTEEQLWKIADLNCRREELGFDYGCFGFSGTIAAYSRGLVSQEETKKLTQRNCNKSEQYAAEIMPSLIASGALSKDWEPYADGLADNIAYLSDALGGFSDPIVWSLCNARNDSWDRDVARAYFGVDDLSKVIVTKVDYQRANHERNFIGTRFYIGQPVTTVLMANGSATTMIAAEVRRRLERERAAGVYMETESPSPAPKHGNTLAREIKKACVLF